MQTVCFLLKTYRKLHGFRAFYRLRGARQYELKGFTAEKIRRTGLVMCAHSTEDSAAEVLSDFFGCREAESRFSEQFRYSLFLLYAAYLPDSFYAFAKSRRDKVDSPDPKAFREAFADSATGLAYERKRCDSEFQNKGCPLAEPSYHPGRWGSQIRQKPAAAAEHRPGREERLLPAPASVNTERRAGNNPEGHIPQRKKCKSGMLRGGSPIAYAPA